MNHLAASVTSLTVWIIPVIFAVTMHEAAHGFMARLFGDMTATRMGRVTLNPVKHIDPFGTVVLPALCLLMPGGGFLFGYAKPVPVNFRAFKHPRSATVAVAIAGPGMNVLLAFVSLLLLRCLPAMPSNGVLWIGENLDNSAYINVFLAVLNMLPLPPLDGGRVLVAILPRPLARPVASLEGSGILILIGLLFFLPMLGAQFGQDWNVFRYIVGMPAQWLHDSLARVAGLE